MGGGPRGQYYMQQPGAYPQQPGGKGQMYMQQGQPQGGKGKGRQNNRREQGKGKGGRKGGQGQPVPQGKGQGMPNQPPNTNSANGPSCCSDSATRACCTSCSARFGTAAG